MQHNIYALADFPWTFFKQTFDWYFAAFDKVHLWRLRELQITGVFLSINPDWNKKISSSSFTLSQCGILLSEFNHNCNKIHRRVFFSFFLKSICYIAQINHS